MRKRLDKTPPTRLDLNNFRALHRQVLARDCWHCQNCGRMQNLQVHHQQFRSHSGSDEEHNLITLCVECHEVAHWG